ncbi:MAG: PhzF family phenazine biosynthesis protein [Acidobacteriaceae bacterium]|nr:PhzF family phenazine biosynthesis protein [Acidobacteriaceae bacterium]MBV9293981.1 PhzF family phenazine biosynthesis protein [Acidobacteriaceae bacterium]
MEIPIFQVDAFSSSVFSGNPAAVCPLEEWLPDATLQAIAAENNLAETAYFVPNGNAFHLRWFTPVCEVDLCGHATLASAHVLFEELKAPGEVLRFATKSGELVVKRDGDLLSMNFPSWPPARIDPDPRIAAALGGNPVEILASRDFLARYNSAADVRALSPDMEALKSIGGFAFIATAPGTDCDFVSRFFAPSQGIPEDPVTGSAHCTLIPYWAGELGKTNLHAKQISRRGGELFCKLAGDRVEIAGQTALFLKGKIVI